MSRRMMKLGVVGRGVAALVIVLAVMLAPGVTRPAAAASVYFGDYGGDTYAQYGPNATVSITGDLSGCTPDIFGQFSASVYVVGHGSINPSAAQQLGDTPDAVIVSDFTGGLYDDEVIGFTAPSGKLGVGDYDIAMTCGGPVFDPANGSQVFGYDQPHGAFSVVIPANVPVLPDPDIQALKSNSAQEASHWGTSAKSTAALFVAYDTYAILSDFIADYTDPSEVAGIAINFYLNWVCIPLTANATTPITPYCPTVGWTDIMRLQMGVVKEQQTQAAHYQAIANDPPDANDSVPVTLGPTTTYLPHTADPTEAVYARLGTQVSTQSATTAALLDAIQKYEGAQQANDPSAALLQANAIQRYAALAASSLSDTNSRLTDVLNQVSANGQDYAGHAAFVASLQQQLATSGFSPEQLSLLRGAGLSDADIADLQARLVGPSNSTTTALDTYQLTSTAQSDLSTIIADNNATISALQQLNTDIGPIISTLQSQVSGGWPVAAAGGPYSGTVGSPITFNAAASTAPAGDTLSYAWDLTGSGTFTDATVAQPGFTFAAPRSGLVGVQVTDTTTGRTDVAYAPLTVSAPYAAPSISSLSPAGSLLSATPGSPISFSATVNHSAPGALSYQWLLDGAPASSNATYAPTFTTAQAGLHTVQLNVQDAGGAAQASVAVLVPEPLAASFTLPSDVVATTPATFVDTSTSAMTWSWDFGDGSPISTDPHPSHTYANPGTFTVSLTVGDGNGNTSTTQQQLTVAPYVFQYTDTFAGPGLDPFWTWAPGGNAGDSMAFTPAGLAITSNHTDYWVSNNTDPLISTSQTGDWTLRTQVKATPSQSYDMLGVLVSDPSNPNNFFKFGYTWDDRIAHLPALAAYDPQLNCCAPLAGLAYVDTSTPYLQVQKVGTTYTLSYSADGTHWTQLTQLSGSFGTQPRIALFSQGTSRTFTGTFAQFAFNTTLPGPANASAVTPPPVHFSDTFAGPSLNPFWTFNQGGSANNSYLLTQGGLVLTSSFTDYFPGTYTAPTLYSTQAGDWDARVQVNATVSQNYDELGLLVTNAANPGQFWKFGYGWSGGGTYTDVYDGSGHGGPGNVFPATASPYLRVTKVGDVYTFYYSTDGATWVQQYQGVWHFGDTLHLSLWAQGTSRTFAGRFLQFSLNGALPGPAPSAAPPVAFDLSGASETNVALLDAGATATATSQYASQYAPQEMLRAVPTSIWATGSGQTANQYATVTLAGSGNSSLVDAVVITPRTDGYFGQRPQEFALETSLDGTTWTPALFGSVPYAGTPQRFNLPVPQAARYVRYRPLDNWGDNCCISTAQFQVLTGQISGPTVTFTNLSQPGVSGFQWSFGDGATSTDTSPTHTYAAPGDYTVTLSGTDAAGPHSYSLVQHVQATTSLSLVAAPTSPSEGQLTSLTLGATLPGGHSLLSASVDFGDGSPAVNALQNGQLAGLQHTWETPGTFTLTLRVQDNQGVATTLQQPIVVTSGPTISTPEAFFNPQSSGRNVALLQAGASVDAVSSQYGGCYTAQTLLDYATDNCSWASANGQTSNQWIKVHLVPQTNGTPFLIDRVRIMPRPDYESQRPIHIAVDVSSTTDDDAAFTNVLTATLADNGNLQEFLLPQPVFATYLRYRELDNRGDTCCISTGQLKAISQQQGGPPVSFQNLSAADKVSFTWDFGDGSAPVSTTSRDPLAHTFPNTAASYTVTLRAFDAASHEDDFQLVQTVLQAPTVGFSYQPLPPNEGQGATFTPTFSDPNGLATPAWAQWNWGDGSAPTIVETNVSAPVQHTFPNNGSYTVQLQMVDAAELAGQTQQQVAVANVNPAVSLPADQNILAGRPLSFSPTISRPGTQDVPSCVWDYGDGTVSSPSQDCTFNHTYISVLPGQPAQTFTATLTATDPDGAKGSNSLHVTVQPGRPGRAVAGQLFFTTYCGGPNVHQLPFTYDGLYSLTLPQPTTVAVTNGADGLIFDPAGELLVAGQNSGNIYAVTTSGNLVSTTHVGASSFHLTLSPDGTTLYSMDDYDTSPGQVWITPVVNGTPHGTPVRATIQGDDTSITSIAFDGAGHAYYTSGGTGGYGPFGSLTISGSTLTTHRLINSNLPAAHGMVYDPYTQDLLIFGASHVTQIDPTTASVVADRNISADFPPTGYTFDQGTADGQGHLLVADNGGRLLFIDYAQSRNIADPLNFVTTPPVLPCMDDVAPLAGAGSADQVPPTSTLAATPLPNTAGWNNGPVALHFSATDAAATGVLPSGVARITALDGATPLTCPPGDSCDATLTTEGTHTITYWATDNADNEETPHHTATIRIDSTAPTTTGGLSGGTQDTDGSYQTTPTLTLQATDPALSDGGPGSGVAQTRYAVLPHAATSTPPDPANPAAWITYAAPVTFEPGAWDVYASSTDVAGNVEAPVRVAQLTVQTPVVTPPGGGGNPSATPELDSLALFGSGIFGLLGYAVTRRRAGRRRRTQP